MKSMKTSSRRFLMVGGLAALLAGGLGGIAPRPVTAHEAKCPYCKLDVVQDTKTLDNEVALKYGRKRIEARCVFCALAIAKKDVKGDLTITAPSEAKGKPVLITRTGGKWSATPSTAVFAGKKVNHRQCQTGYRAFTNRAGFDSFVNENHKVLHGAKPLTLNEIVSLAK